VETAHLFNYLKGNIMNGLLCICFLCFIFLQGCSQGDTAPKKDAVFANYINSNTEQQETTNQQSNAIVNIAF